MNTSVICRCDSELFCRVYESVPLDLSEWDDIVQWSPVTTVCIGKSQRLYLY